jgi:hypothetical protein
MKADTSTESNQPIDVVIAWVDGNDPLLTEKRNRFLNGTGIRTHPGAHPTRFASINEIRYCVLSVFRFAPFVRNIFIVTDGQDPNLYEDVKTYFPERLNSLRIVDHREIFEGFEKHLPTFNSISIGNMIWRIRGLSENFVYFNDDTFLIRPVKPEDWFVGDKPVLRGKWAPAPVFRILWHNIRKTANIFLLNTNGFQPRASFHMGQSDSGADISPIAIRRTLWPEKQLKIFMPAGRKYLKKTSHSGFVIIRNSPLFHYQIICSFYLATGRLQGLTWHI